MLSTMKKNHQSSGKLSNKFRVFCNKYIRVLIYIFILIFLACQNNQGDDSPIEGIYERVNKEQEMHSITITRIGKDTYGIKTKGVNKKGKSINAYQQGTYDTIQRKLFSNVAGFGLTLEFSEDFKHMNFKLLDVLEKFDRK